MSTELEAALSRLEAIHGRDRMELATVHADMRHAMAIIMRAPPTNDDSQRALRELAQDCAQLYGLAVTAKYGADAIAEGRRIADLSRVLFDLAGLMNLDDIPGNVCPTAAEHADLLALAAVRRARLTP